MKDLSRHIHKNGNGDGGVMSSERGRGGYLPPTMPAPAQFSSRRSPWTGGGGVYGGWKLPPQQSESMDLSTQPLRNGDTPMNGQVKEVSVIATNPAKPSESAVVLENRSLDLRAVDQGTRTVPLKEADLGIRGQEQGPRAAELVPRVQEAGFVARIQEASALREQDSGFRVQMLGNRVQEVALRGPAVVGPRTPDTALRGHILGLRAQDIAHRGQDLVPRVHDLVRGPDIGLRAPDIGRRGQDLTPREETDLGQETAHRAQDLGHRGLDFGARMQEIEYRGQDGRPRAQNVNVCFRGQDIGLRTPPVGHRPQDGGARLQEPPPPRPIPGKAPIYMDTESPFEAQDMCVGAQNNSPKENAAVVPAADSSPTSPETITSKQEDEKMIEEPAKSPSEPKVEIIPETVIKIEDEDSVELVPDPPASESSVEIPKPEAECKDTKDNVVTECKSVELAGEKQNEEPKVENGKTEIKVEDPVESLLENMFEEPPVQHSVIVSPPLTQDKVVAILEEKSGGSGDEPDTKNPFTQVECELEKMFAGIVEEPKPAGGTGRKRKGGPRGRARAEKKKVRKEVKAESKAMKESSGGGFAGKAKGGPYVHVVGKRDSPQAVVVVNNNVEEEGRRAAEGRTRGAGLYVSTLSSRYNSNNVDPSWLCVFCNKRPHCPGGEAAGDLFGPYTVELVSEGEGIGDKEISAEQRKRGWGRPKSLRASGPPYKPSILQQKGNNGSGAEGEVEVWVHEGCAVWAGGVMLIGGRLVGLSEAVSEAKLSKCSECGLPGASLPCAAHACPLRTHYPCATLAPWKLHHQNFTASCPNHKDGTKVCG